MLSISSYRISNTPTTVNNAPIPIATIVTSALPARGNSTAVGLGVLVGVLVGVALGVLVGPGVRVAVGVAVGPDPPIFMERVGSGHLMMSFESESLFILESASVPSVQSKESEVDPPPLALKVTVENRVSVLDDFA